MGKRVVVDWDDKAALNCRVAGAGGGSRAMFDSILFEKAEERGVAEALEAPALFIDLNLDQIVDAITLRKQEYDLKPFFYIRLHNVGAVEYRHEVMQDIEKPAVLEGLEAFAQRLRAMREQLAQANKLYYKYQKERWFLDAVQTYCDAVRRLTADLSLADLRSRGLLAFREYLTHYISSDRFTSLQMQTEKVIADLSTVKYSLLIKSNRITVRRYEAESDYSAEVEETFVKFQQGAVEDYRATFPAWPEMNHIEAQVLEFVAKLHPDVFAGLDSFCAANGDFQDETVSVFDREIQFYIAYLEYIVIFRDQGLAFCYPEVSSQSKEVRAYDTFDLALAHKLVWRHQPIVCNDFWLTGKERILVVSGPNQGGKTTLARTFGQLHYLGSLGCPVPGREARLFLYDKLFTHFEKEENIKNLRGKLEDDLVRIHAILDQATANSIIVMNEIFTSTTLQDAVFLSKQILERIIQLDALCVSVTFIDELASLSETTVSMVSTIVPENPAVRTYKIVRRPADGLAYALAIAEKYKLTRDDLRERLKS